jgi:hypothetical protein
MKRLVLILAGVAVAGSVAATPAVVGLTGNPSFSHEIPVPAPSAAKTPVFADDHSRDDGTAPASARPGDGRGASVEAEPGDDQGITPHAEPGDDRGGQGITPHAEPGDDRGGHRGGRG